MSAAAQIQEAEPIIVWVGRTSDYATFVLHPWTLRDLEREFPGAQRWYQVTIKRKDADLEELGESVQAHVAGLLTGLSGERLAALGDVRFVNPVDESTLAVWSRARR